MQIYIAKTPDALGKLAAGQAAKTLNEAIRARGKARLVLSTGASQFEMFSHLVHEDVDWSKVEMFHLDEYVHISKSHKASFEKYLRERFADIVGLKNAHYMPADPEKVPEVARAVASEPVDLGMIGIGQNGHIAFNDPPADFDTEEPYLVVTLEERCRRQQVFEGWFPTFEDVPKQAVTMSVKQIMKCKKIISVVPHEEKAEAVMNTLTREVTNLVPATILKTHADISLYVDEPAFAKTEPARILMPEGRAYQINRV